MESGKSKFCPAVWLSGFFALGAVVHLVRFLLRVSLVVAGHEIPLAASVVLVFVLGTLSVAFAVVGAKRPCDQGHDTGCCKH